MSLKANAIESSYTLSLGISPARILSKMVGTVHTEPRAGEGDGMSRCGSHHRLGLPSIPRMGLLVGLLVAFSLLNSFHLPLSHNYLDTTLRKWYTCGRHLGTSAPPVFAGFHEIQRKLWAQECPDVDSRPQLSVYHFAKVDTASAWGGFYEVACHP